jgi:hypothetical protein
MFTALAAAGVAAALLASSGYALARSSDDTADTPGVVAPEQDRDRDRLQLHDPDDCVFDGETRELANRVQDRDRNGAEEGETHRAEHTYRERDRDGSSDEAGPHFGSDTAPRDGRRAGQG